MLHKAAIIEVRNRLGIPESGLPDEEKALTWYKEHYLQSKGEEFSKDLGFEYDRSTGYIYFKYEIGPDYFKIFVPNPVDDEVPLDREASLLAHLENTPDWAAPWYRLLILIGEVPEMVAVQAPDHLIAPMGSFRLLIHSPSPSSSRKWRKAGEMMGTLPSETTYWSAPGISTTFSSKRENKMESTYWQVLHAYLEAVEERKKIYKKGKKGLLIETAKTLEANYGWEYEPDSYTVRRYLDRALKIWHISTR
ncbi:hypothetical protein ACFLX3_00380 [Chloroflexota bacterium]